jgi:uncharacterized protein
VTNLRNVLKSIEAADGDIVKPAFGFPGGGRFYFNYPNSYEVAVWSEV